MKIDREQARRDDPPPEREQMAWLIQRVDDLERELEQAEQDRDTARQEAHRLHEIATDLEERVEHDH